MVFVRVMHGIYLNTAKNTWISHVMNFIKYDPSNFSHNFRTSIQHTSQNLKGENRFSRTLMWHPILRQILFFSNKEFLIPLLCGYIKYHKAIYLWLLNIYNQISKDTILIYTLVYLEYEANVLYITSSWEPHYESMYKSPKKELVRWLRGN